MSLSDRPRELCPTCERIAGDLSRRHDPGPSRDVSLRSLHNSAKECALCAFVQTVLGRVASTPAENHLSYEDATLKVEESGLKFTGQWQGAIVVEVYGAGLQPNLPVPKEVIPDMSCEIAAEIISKWMEECVSSRGGSGHSECGANAHPTIVVKGESEVLNSLAGYPKRLIEFSTDGEIARLVSFQKEAPPPYAALSYCWGPNSTFKTTKSTVSQFKTSIPLFELPLTLKDAFMLTTKLKLSYLWVDAICIVQDDTQDWDSESAKMGQIYKNAQIVLTATATMDVHQGMFLQRNTTLLTPDIPSTDKTMYARRNMNHEIIVSCRTKSSKWWETNINTTFPVLSRGWCFQERLLATRILHFTPTELVWECQRTRKCECGVVQSHLYPAKNSMSSALRLCTLEPVSERRIRQMWREIVRSYSVRKLTVMDDKLPALAGVASLLRTKTQDIYVAGLWKSALPFDLLWRYDQSGVMVEKKTRAPSWSWASVDGAVKWPVSQEVDAEQPLQYLVSTTYFEYGARGVEVCDVGFDLEGEDEFGRVSRAWIKLYTRLVPATIYNIEDSAWEESHGTEWAVQVDKKGKAPVWLDVSPKGLGWDPETKAVIKGLFILEIMQPGDVSGTWEEGLVVELREGSPMLYERVGVAANVSLNSAQKWVTLESWFDHTPPNYYTIV